MADVNNRQKVYLDILRFAPWANMVTASIWERAMWWSAYRGCVAAVFFALTALSATPGAFAQSEYEYDPLGRLTKVTRDDGSTTEYWYDAGDNRVDVVSVVSGEPAFSIDDVAVSEGGTLSFTVTKTGLTTLTHAVSYATANGTASLGDYSATSGTLTFTSGQIQKTVMVATIEDAAVESDETVLLNLSSPTNGATISHSQGVGTINNDDVPNSPPVAVNDTVYVSPGASVALYPLVNDTDPDGHELTITYVSPSEGGSASVSPNGKSINYTAPGGGWVDFLTYSISDGHGGTDSGNLAVVLQ